MLLCWILAALVFWLVFGGVLPYLVLILMFAVDFVGVFNSVGIITLCYAYCLDFGLDLALAVVALFERVRLLCLGCVLGYGAWVVCLVR